MNFAACVRKPPEPVELVVEFRPGLRVAVRQIEAGDDDAVDGGLDIARLESRRDRRAARCGSAPDRPCAPGSRRRSRSSARATPRRSRPSRSPRSGNSASVAFSSCSPTTSGLGRAQPAQQVRQAAVDIVDVEGRDLHGELALTVTRSPVPGDLMSKLRFARSRLRHRIFRIKPSPRPPISAAPARRTMTNIAPAPMPGGGRVVACLNKQHDQLTDACKKVLASRKQ